MKKKLFLSLFGAAVVIFVAVIIFVRGDNNLFSGKKVANKEVKTSIAEVNTEKQQAVKQSGIKKEVHLDNFDANKEFLEKEHIKVLKDGTMIDKNGWIVEKVEKGRNRITYKAMPDFKMEKVWESAEIDGEIINIRWKETDDFEYPERIFVKTKVKEKRYKHYLKVIEFNGKGEIIYVKKVEREGNDHLSISSCKKYTLLIYGIWKDRSDRVHNGVRIYDEKLNLILNKEYVGWRNAVSPAGKYFLGFSGEKGLIELYDIKGNLIEYYGTPDPEYDEMPSEKVGTAYLGEKYAFVMIYDNTHEKDIKKNYVEFYVLNYNGSIVAKIREDGIARSGNPSFYVFPDEDKFALSIHKPVIYRGYTNIYTIDGEEILDVPSISSIYYISENSKYLLMKPSPTSSMGYLINMESKTWNNLNKFFGMGDVKVLNDGNIFFVFQDMIPMINKKGDHVRQNFNEKLASYYANKINYSKNLYSEIAQIGENK